MASPLPFERKEPMHGTLSKFGRLSLNKLGVLQEQCCINNPEWGCYGTCVAMHVVEFHSGRKTAVIELQCMPKYQRYRVKYDQAV